MTEDEMVGALREIIEREFGAGAADEAERRCMTPQWRDASPREPIGACNTLARTDPADVAVRSRSARDSPRTCPPRSRGD
jgi:hypothetical protein